ncbi:MAG: hypothetical protein ACOYI8_08340 [Christensenellales bacterium]
MIGIEIQLTMTARQSGRNVDLFLSLKARGHYDHVLTTSTMREVIYLCVCAFCNHCLEPYNEYKKARQNG